MGIGWVTSGPLSYAGTPASIFSRTLSYRAQGNVTPLDPGVLLKYAKVGNPISTSWNGSGQYNIIVISDYSGISVSFVLDDELQYRYEITDFASTTYYSLFHANMSAGSTIYNTNLNLGSGSGVVIDGYEVGKTFKSLLESNTHDPEGDHTTLGTLHAQTVEMRRVEPWSHLATYPIGYPITSFSDSNTIASSFNSSMEILYTSVNFKSNRTPTYTFQTRLVIKTGTVDITLQLA